MRPASFCISSAGGIYAAGKQYPLMQSAAQFVEAALGLRHHRRLERVATMTREVQLDLADCADTLVKGAKGSTNARPLGPMHDDRPVLSLSRRRRVHKH